MKLTKYLLIVAIFGAGLFVSCTPENVEDGQNDQQVDTTGMQAPRQG